MSRIRNTFLIQVILFVSFDIFAQGISLGNSTSIFDVKYKIKKNSLLLRNNEIYRLNSNQKINILDQNGDTVFISLENIEEQISIPIDSQANLSRVVKQKDQVYFLKDQGSTKLAFSDFDISPLVVPIKIRPRLNSSPLQFTGDVSIGPYLGYQFGSQYFENNEINEIASTLCAFLSPSLINVDKSDGNQSLKSNDNLLGITSGVGYLLNFNNYQFGLIAGIDWISALASTIWIYQGKPWYSFSFAYNLSNK